MPKFNSLEEIYDHDNNIGHFQFEPVSNKEREIFGHAFIMITLFEDILQKVKSVIILERRESEFISYFYIIMIGE